MKCSVCGAENPGNNKFCSSCGKSLPQSQPLTKNIPPVAGQTPVPATPKGPELGLVLLVGGVLFLIAVMVVGIFVILPMFEEETSSWEESGISSSQDLTDPDDSDHVADSSNSLVSGSAENPRSLPVTATPLASQPVQDRSSTVSGDPIIGTWDIGTTGMQMQFDGDGAATLSSASGHSSGSWEKISDGRYRSRSASGTISPVLMYDPLAGMMYSEDYSTVFIRTG